MKKTLLTLVILSYIGIAQAEYIMQIPLEQTKGGGLPNGTINIVTKPIVIPTENWQPFTASFSEWVNKGSAYDCMTWTPAKNTQNIGVEFQQTSNDCKQEQTRIKQEREKDSVSSAVRDVGEPIIETQSVTGQLTRQETGTKENWVAATATDSGWVNKGEIYGCTNWTPSTSIYFKDSSFTQNATDCKQDQMSTKQNREQETTTLAYRNVGDPINVTNTLMVKSSRTTIGTADCLYRLNSGGLPNIYWQSGKDSSANTYVIYVNGSQLKADVGYSINTVTVNGVTYTRGTTVRYTGTATNGAIYLFYDVCK